MARTWTKAQSTAIETRDKTLLVSAAAGSGKTATLVERIVRSITDKKENADISRMLIVTYTKAAAGELRERVHAQIAAALANEPNNRHLQKQMILVESARISTIHSFCLELIRANFQRLSLSPSFRIADTAELSLLARNIINDMIDEAFESDTDPYAVGDGLDFAAFVDNFAGSRDDKNLCDIFMSLYDDLNSYPEGVDLLEICAKGLAASSEEGFFDTPYGLVLKNLLTEAFAAYRGVYSDACEHFVCDEVLCEKYLPAFEDDLAYIEKMLQALELGGFDNVREIIRSYEATPLGRAKADAVDEDDRFFVQVRNDVFKSERQDFENDIFLHDNATHFENARKTARMCAYLYRFLHRFDKLYGEEKKRRGICGFSDIERYAYELLYENGKKSDLAIATAALFDYVYIDEYQDVNAVQDMIFSAISTDKNRFMVGDIKQSIYGFRGAEPSIFSNYRKNYPDIFGDGKDAAAAAIFMSDNFRCDENVVKFVNLISRYTMQFSSIDYRDEDDLQFKKKENTGTSKAKCLLFEKNKSQSVSDDTEQESNEAYSAEAEAVASEIERLIREEKKNNGDPIRPGDIAILLQSVKKSGPAFVNALEKRGIRSSGSFGTELFDSPEILLMLCLLNVIDNPRRDIYLAGLLRSPLYNFTMSDLVELRDFDDGGKMSLYDMLVAHTERYDTGRGRYFLSKLEKYREMASGMAVDKLVWALYRDTAALSLLTRDAKTGRISREKRDNLMLFYEYAASFESSSFKGLYNFIRYINGMIEDAANLDIGSEDSQSADEVRIMTIHHSKGLEMPVCFVCDLAKPFNKMDLNSGLLFDYSLGVAMRLRDATGFARYSTLCRDAISKRIWEKQNEELMRSLYVALTRARERLYVSATLRSDIGKIEFKQKLYSKYPCKHFVNSASSYLDWILGAIGMESGERYDVSIISSVESNSVVVTEDKETAVCSAEDIERAKAKISKKLSFKYKLADLPQIPAKMSVSRLYPELLDPEASEILEGIPEMKSAPAFVSGSFAESAAEKGTATHVFMQFCDFALLEKNGAKEEISRLVEKRFISKGIAELVNVYQIEKFIKSEFFKRIKVAKKVWREFRFNLDLPAHMFASNEEAKQKLIDQSVLVQGVIDCFFEEDNGDIILCDYKTDFLDRNELEDREKAKAKLVSRHGEQLGYYKKAIELICGSAPAHTYIYSLPLGDVIEL